MLGKKVLLTGANRWFSSTIALSRAVVNKVPIGSLSISAINSCKANPRWTINAHYCCCAFNGRLASRNNSDRASSFSGKTSDQQVFGVAIQQTKEFHTSREDLAMSLPNIAKDSPVIFRQLFEHKSYTYSYLLACLRTKHAIIIDPVFEMVPRDVRIVEQLGLTLKHAINTHVHADHITGSGKLKQKLPGATSMLGEDSGAKADIYLQHGQKIQVGDIELEARKTPGHTDGCMTYVWHDQRCVFTGDAILIRGCGRTDFQQGSADRLYNSVHSQIFSLPEDYVIYPAHDYTGQPWTTVGEEKKYNPRLTKTKEEFIQLMNNLNLPYPKQIDRALPANMICGVVDEEALDSSK